MFTFTMHESRLSGQGCFTRIELQRSLLQKTKLEVAVAVFIGSVYR